MDLHGQFRHLLRGNLETLNERKDERSVVIGHLLKIAFEDYYIDRADHPIIRRLRGMV